MTKLGNKGKLTAKWRLPSSEITAYAKGVDSVSSHLYFDPSTLQLYSRVPHNNRGELFVHPSSDEGRKALQLEVQEALGRLVRAAESDADDEREWTRVIRVTYSSATTTIPRWDGRDGVLIREETPAGWYESRSSSITEQVSTEEARSRGGHYEVSPYSYRRATVLLDEKDCAGRGSDVVGPLIITRLEVSYDPEWFEKYGPGAKDWRRDYSAQQPMLHYREWEEDYAARLAAWEENPKRKKGDAPIKRGREATNTPFSGQVLPWNPQTWQQLQDLQEKIRKLDRNLRRLLVHSPEGALLGVLSGGNLLGGS